MKKRKLGCLIPLILLLAFAAGIILWLRIPTSFRAFHLVSQMLDQKAASGTITVHTDGFSCQIPFFWNTIGDERYLCLELNGETLYCHDASVWFDTGRGYDLSGVLDSLALPEELDEKVLLLGRFQQEALPDGSRLTMELTQEQLQRVLPSTDTPSRLRLSMTESDGSLSTIAAELGQNTSVTVSLNSVCNQRVPTEMVMQMTDESLTDIRVMEPVFRACFELAGQEVSGAEAKLNVVCGPLPIRDTAALYRTGGSLYFVRGGNVMELFSGEQVDDGTLGLALAWSLCRDGIWTSTGRNAGILAMPVSPEVLDRLLVSLIPELDGLGITLGEGALEVAIEQAEFVSFTLGCAGEFPFLVTTVPLEIEVELNRMEGQISLPEEIR